MRCLALAHVWRSKGGNVVFISHCESDAIRKRINTGGIDFVALDRSHPDPFDIGFTISILKELKNKKPTLKLWVAVDGYCFDANYQKSIKAAGYNLLWIDDYGHATHYYADLILNQNISADSSIYINREPYTKLLLGTRYALLRREFKRWQGWRREIRQTARKVLVTLGGGNTGNATLKVIKALKQVNLPGLEAKIVIGHANPNLELLKKEIGDESKLDLLIDVADMSNLMAWADVAISGGGSTCWELSFMGLPSLILMTAENQRGNAEVLDRESIGINLGWHQDVRVEGIISQVRHLIMNPEMLSLMSQRGQLIVNGNGGEQIANIIEGHALKIRPALPEDCERVWKWANDPSVRAVSFLRESITWEDHIRWFQERMNRPYFYIAIDHNDLPIGQVRFDQKETETVISVIVDRDFRNRGYGDALIRMGCEEMFLQSNARAIHAYVKLDNKASKRAFIRAGFKEMPETVCQGHPAYHFILDKTLNNI